MVPRTINASSFLGVFALRQEYISVVQVHSVYILEDPGLILYPELRPTEAGEDGRA